ncbi:HAD family hydrolase [Hymenobacter jejuensis]|uniref:phosphoglycolate phosphatase n=1 Tax=Hymenobacter jejuensis TaxID=2502781 RepID=A0A5B8A1F0_9BACT|nr:HAD family hydrolase [Hymenobacter jejuensis]QDA61214.1 HAD family hydrolase [Hymenobacter jejuensis]
MPYSLLLFDYDGTLCDSRQAIQHSIQQFFLEAALPVPPQAEIQRILEMGFPTFSTLKALQPNTPPETVAGWVPTYRAIYAEQGEPLVRPFPGAREVLAQATAQGAAVVVLSNKGAAILESSLDRLGLLPYVSLLIGDGSFPDKQLQMKPNPMIFHEVVQPQYPQVRAQEILMIGDTSADLEFARNSGIDSCWARFGFGNAEECLALDPTHQIDELSGVLTLV